LLTKEQKQELDAYMERIRAEYLQKILEQVNNQNIDYFENLACEYSVQYQVLAAAAASPDQKQPGDEDGIQSADAFAIGFQASETGQKEQEDALEESPSKAEFAPEMDPSSAC